MSWVENQGHRWPCSNGSYYDHQKQQLAICDDQPAAQEPCQYCGMPFVKFSFALQQGTIIPCNKHPNSTNRRIVDGIVIVGPEA
jgi:hypothetical protein